LNARELRMITSRAGLKGGVNSSSGKNLVDALLFENRVFRMLTLGKLPSIARV